MCTEFGRKVTVGRTVTIQDTSISAVICPGSAVKLGYCSDTIFLLSTLKFHGIEFFISSTVSLPEKQVILLCWSLWDLTVVRDRTVIFWGFLALSSFFPTELFLYYNISLLSWILSTLSFLPWKNRSRIKRIWKVYLNSFMLWV